ncbi:MAG: phytoene/squalene synthase family protein [Planctomycetota bacterium]
MITSDSVHQSDSWEVIQHHSRSFSLASRLLPKRIRRDVWNLYAWCRAADDAVDQTTGADEARETLALLKSDIQVLVDGESPRHPASQWLRPLIRGGRIDPTHAIELIEGMEMDANGFHVQTFGDLRRYCYHAAGTVGLMMTRLMGVNDRDADRDAVSLGIAMQMTNIVRDVREDADRGRCYLPGIEDIRKDSPAHVRSVCAAIIREAETQYDNAIEGIAVLPSDCHRAIRLALVFYREIHREVERQDFPGLQRRTIVPKRRLVQLAIPIALINFSPVKFHSKKESTMSDIQPATMSNRAQAWHAVFLGLSLTAIMASVLFVLVYINPKEQIYGYLPLVYAGISLTIAVLTNRAAAKCEIIAAPSA